MPYTLAMTNSVLYAFNESDFFGKGIVIFLFMVSIYLWSTMLSKSRQVKQYQKENKEFYDLFESTSSVVDAVTLETNDCALFRIYSCGIRKTMQIFHIDNNEAVTVCNQGRIPRDTSSEERKAIMAAIESSMNTEMIELEKSMGHLATIVGASPFLGLLGTVWGVMAAFVGMAQQNSADIGALAPGISGALLTTVCGLLVAIPSVIGYNNINAEINNVSVLMENFIHEFHIKLQIENSLILEEKSKL
jgi:biopolymer transport protein TolQ